MKGYDFEASIGYWITMTSHFYEQRLNEELAPYGITFRQFQVLAWLFYTGDLSQAELSQRLMIEPPTLSGILDRMQREGWIQRRPSDTDRRRKVVRLQPSARAVWEKVVVCLTGMRDRATENMSGRDVETLKRLLSKVQENLGVSPWPRPGEASRPIEVELR